MQKTLKNPVLFNGIGLHSGCNVNVSILPAKENSGIIFKRVDLPEKPEVKALYSYVVDTRNCTAIKANDAFVSTIEHIMAALWAYGIDNALIEIDNQEFPIMDGSAKAFCDILRNAELKEQNAPKKYLKVLKNVRFEDKDGNWVELLPADKFKIDFTIDFPSKIVGHQKFSKAVNKEIFVDDIAPARTFCEKYQVDYLRSVGLIKGGSLQNAVVLDGEQILNPEGFRLENECVKHKSLDAIGDLYTSGYCITGAFRGFHSGHFHNNELLKKLFADTENFEIIED